MEVSEVIGYPLKSSQWINTFIFTPGMSTFPRHLWWHLAGGPGLSSHRCPKFPRVGWWREGVWNEPLEQYRSLMDIDGRPVTDPHLFLPKGHSCFIHSTRHFMSLSSCQDCVSMFKGLPPRQIELLSSAIAEQTVPDGGKWWVYTTWLGLGFRV